MNPEIWFPNLGIEIEHLDRVAINLFGRFPIYWYGIIMVSAILIAIAYVGREAKRTGQDPDWYYDLAIYGIIGAIIGARTYYVIFSWESYKNNLLKIFALREGGLALYGSLIGGALALFIYTRIKKHSFLLFTDTIAPAYMFAQAIGRWGNFVNREAFGGYTENLLAMRYRLDTVQQTYIPAQVMEKLVTVDSSQYIQVHPTFLYESLWNILGFAILLFLKDRKKYNGQITAYYFIIYGLGRFWIESLRTDQLRIGSTGIAISMVLSVAFIAAAVVFLAVNKNKPSVAVELEEAIESIGDEENIESSEEAESIESDIMDETREDGEPQ